jgi:cardiolipin synthase
MRDIPNIISLLRILLVLPVVWLLLNKEYSLALMLFFVAGISDGIDGYLAKRNHWESRLGSILDPLADKLLLISSYMALGWLGNIPMWLVLVVLLRDLVIVMGAVTYHVKFGEFEMTPTVVSKINTFFQILLVLAVVFSQGLYALPGRTLEYLTFAVLATTLMSGADYVWVWGKKAMRAARQPGE